MNLSLGYRADVGPGPAQARWLQEAIDRVHRAGGGVLSLGPGVYPVTTVFLRSGVELCLQRGAQLQAWPDLDAYPVAPPAADNKDQTRRHLLAAFDAQDVAVTGPGQIDGQDAAFWEPCVREEDWPYGIFRFRVRGSHDRRLSPLLNFVRCRNVRLEDFCLCSPPGWGIHLFECEDVAVRGVTVRGHPYGPNTDGVVINGSRNVRVTECDVDTGDDAITVKATNPGQETRDVIVSNCVVASNCAALAIGADVRGTVRDVMFSACAVKKSLRMLQVEMWFPGQVQRAVFTAVTGRTFPDAGVENERPIYVDIQRQFHSQPTLGRVEDVVFRDILCESRGRIVLTAQDGACLKGVTLDTVLVRVPEIEDPQRTVPRARSLQLSNGNPLTRAARAAVVADNVRGLTLRHVVYRWPVSPQVGMHGLCLRHVRDLVDESPFLAATGEGWARVLRMEA